MTVDPGGTVRIVAPERFPIDRLDVLVRRKAPWIMQQRRNLQSLPALPTPREFVSGESVYYLGRHYRLKVHPGALGDAKLRGGWLHVPTSEGAEQTAHVRASLVSWFRRQAEERLPARTEAWSAKAGVTMPLVAIVDQQKRGGAATATGPSA